MGFYWRVCITGDTCQKKNGNASVPDLNDRHVTSSHLVITVISWLSFHRFGPEQPSLVNDTQLGGDYFERVKIESKSNQSAKCRILPRPKSASRILILF